MATVPEGEMRMRLTRQFAELGIASDRITFYGKLPAQEFKRKLQEADITLDPFPVNGATTTCESLWLGVPVLTLVGAHFLSRAGLSVLSAARLPEFAAATPEDYIRTAISLADDLPRLAAIRAGMRERLLATPLLDQQRFTRSLEGIYRDVWRQYAAQHRSPQISESKRSPASAVDQKARVLTASEMNQLAALFHAKEFVTLERVTQSILEEDQNCGFAWQLLGAALEMQGKDGLHAMKRAANILVDDAQAQSNLGKILKDRAEYFDAAKYYSRAIALKPDFAEAHCGLGMCQRKLGQLHGAIASYRRALALNLNYFEAHCNLGNALVDISLFPEAIESFRRALQLKPDSGLAHANLAGALRDLGRLDEGMQSFRRALELDADRAEVHDNLLMSLQFV
ncbi:MAG TPA: tetratricopeptide repeat protein, partial [Burkholderiaceae bacterium]|nr:tetratricopeptide repeat protein [Burkholderiaceae bacterium]